ncbi:MAG: SDR family oxidoreductase [Bacteroidota bacterium]|nr:SDR family oxidoreductase [Bacteroidota bacterium]
MNLNLKDRDADFINRTVFLVTGGAGFIGSNIVNFLVEARAKEIRIVDNLATGNFSTIADLIKENKVTFINGDIRDLPVCQKASEGVDVILHQAALGSVQRSIIDPATTNSVNVDGFINMLSAAKDAGVKKFIYASSSSVYGDDPSMPKREEKTGNLLSPYAVTKRTGEEYARVFKNLYGLNTVGLRYFNVFGPAQDVNGPYAAVIPLFIEAMLSGKPVTIFGDGENTRDFTFVENVVLANVKAAIAELPANELPVLNIAFGGTTSLNTLHRVLSDLTGNTIPPVYKPVRVGDIRDSFADISRAKKLLKFDPTVKLEDGLRLTVEWFTKKKEALAR